MSPSQILLKNLFTATISKRGLRYKEVNAYLIEQAINNFNLEKVVSNYNINEKASIFCKKISKVLNNYILHETMICDGKDPQCFNSWIKFLVENKNKLHKNYQMFKSDTHLLIKQNLLEKQLHLSINKSKKVFTQKWRAN